MLEYMLWGGLGIDWKPFIGGTTEKAVEAQNLNMNMASYYKELYKLLNIAISVFKWNNLPEGIDERQLELWLISRGFAIFFYDEDLKYDMKARAPEGYAVLEGTMHGPIDFYNLGIDRNVYSANGYNKNLDESNSVVIFNNRLRTPEIFALMLYAQRIAEIDRTIDVNVQNQKSPKVIHCEDSQRLTMKNFIMKVIGNMYTIFADKNLNTSNIEVFDMTVPFVGEDLDRLKRRYTSEAMTYLGIEGVDSDKKERLIGQEILRGMGDVEAMRFTRLTARQQAAKEINDKFGLDVSVDFRSGIYIQTGESHNVISPSTGMISGDLGNADGGYENE